jgi:DNA/RNA-binding domain of Phe-tRNA-synthetase-like protein
MIKMNQEIISSGVQVSFGLITGEVSVLDTSEVLKEYIDSYILNEFDFNKDPKTFPCIAGGRKLYRALGKDPTRYRLSSEAIIRRVRSHKDLYSINDIVDCMNLFSLMTGVPVGLYDLEKIEGEIIYRPGREGEQYEGLGKGSLNITDLPVLSDGIGAFGSATSDSLRTAITLSTHKFLLIIFSFDDEEIKSKIDLAKQMVSRFVYVKSMNDDII